MLAVCAANSAAGQSSDQPAAMLVFPYVVADSGRGVDTVIQLSNTDTAAADVSCFFEDDTQHCSNSQNACSSAADCSGGAACLPSFQVVFFKVRLTARQPLGWRASQGLAQVPLPGQGAIPSVPEDPFVGSLRCIKTDAQDIPAPDNVLTGDSTIEQFQPGLLNATRYGAIGLQATGTSTSGPDVLVIGGDSPEYASCPFIVSFSHFFEGALEPVSNSSRVETTLVVVPCGVDLEHNRSPLTTVQLDVTNEYGQHMAGQTFTVNGQYVARLSAIDSVLFDVGLQGTLTGHTTLNGEGTDPLGNGVLALVVETHRQIEGPERSASRNVQVQGALATPDLIVGRQCRGDCNSDRVVSIDEIVQLVNIGFAAATVDTCANGDRNADGEITIDEIVASVNSILDGCPPPL